MQPLIELGSSIITFTQIVSVDRAYDYEKSILDLLGGDHKAFDMICLTETFNSHKYRHVTLPGSPNASDDHLVFTADFPREVFSSFMETVGVNVPRY
ncbi:hypothetical protein EDF68_102498 [Ochrobactrum sp. BH3]|nr:hypothetical protein EDF68_102498 [Ochrobactrum sp. BH3]